jgi:hypothetical protein
MDYLADFLLGVFGSASKLKVILQTIPRLLRDMASRP